MVKLVLMLIFAKLINVISFIVSYNTGPTARRAWHGGGPPEGDPGQAAGLAGQVPV